MSMASRIKNKRIEYGMTQEELAIKLGLQKSAIAKYENGRVTNIKRSTIAKLAELFDCDPSWIMDLDDSSDDPTATTHCLEAPAVLSGHEWDTIRKYRNLDPSGRTFVDTVLDREYNRCSDSKAEEGNISAS